MCWKFGGMVSYPNRAFSTHPPLNTSHTWQLNQFCAKWRKRSTPPPWESPAIFAHFQIISVHSVGHIFTTRLPIIVLSTHNGHQSPHPLFWKDCAAERCANFYRRWCCVLRKQSIFLLSWSGARRGIIRAQQQSLNARLTRSAYQIRDTWERESEIERRTPSPGHLDKAICFCRVCLIKISNRHRAKHLKTRWTKERVVGAQRPLATIFLDESIRIFLGRSRWKFYWIPSLFLGSSYKTSVVYIDLRIKLNRTYNVWKIQKLYSDLPYINW